MKPICSTENFTDFSQYDCIYVDKTEYIYNLALLPNRIFISRPRRFGKSLTLNTIATLFESGIEPYFKGTWIYDKWKDTTYPVLRINLVNFAIKDLNKFKLQLTDYITAFANKNHVEGYIANGEPNVAIKNLLDSLNDAKRKVVVLIDEYDCQMTANINNHDLYDDFKDCLREFYGAIKGKAAIRFLGVTGVTRLKNVSIFSVGSDIEDLTNDSSYSQLIGFTKDEIRKFYIDYLKMATAYEYNIKEDNVTDEQLDSMLDKLAQNYDGYCFDEDYEKKVFSTWSVNNFFQNVYKKKKVQFGEYWYSNGGVPSILANYLTSHELNIFDFLNKDIIVKVTDDEFENPTALTDINQSVLMCQTGYLTLRSSITDSNIIALGIPNGEVYKALNKLLAAKFFKEKIDVTNVDNENILDVGSVEDIISLLNTIVNTVTYDEYPISSEATVQNYVKMYMLGAKQTVLSEVHQAKGRVDLIIETNKRRIVFEFKFAQNEAQSKAKLLMQILR